MNLPLRRSLLALAVIGLSGVASAENWPGWRGPSGNGISGEKNLPTEWSPTKNVAWKVALPGAAGATPVVWDNRIYLTSVNDAGDLLLMAFDSTGNKVARGDEGNSASPRSEERRV